VLRRLLLDSDGGVRALAAALLGKRSRQAEAGAISDAGVPTPKAPGAAVDSVKAATIDAGLDPDLRPDLGAAGADAGAPRAAENTDEASETSSSAKLSQPEQLLRSGIESAARHDLRKAQRQLEKASLLCVRNRKAAPSCPSLLSEVALRLGQLHEEQKEFGEAMAEYQRVLGQGGSKAVAKPSSSTRTAAERGVDRLSPLLGQVMVARQEKGKCVHASIWLAPGTHMVRLGSKFETIQIRAKEKVAVGSCDN
jgi:hypothetical protein